MTEYSKARTELVARYTQGVIDYATLLATLATTRAYFMGAR